METKIKQFYNLRTHRYGKWYIAIRSWRDGRYHILFNGDVPHMFDTQEEAIKYRKSVRKELEELVESEPNKNGVYSNERIDK